MAIEVMACSFAFMLLCDLHMCFRSCSVICLNDTPIVGLISEPDRVGHMSEFCSMRLLRDAMSSLSVITVLCVL